MTYEKATKQYVKNITQIINCGVLESKRQAVQLNKDLLQKDKTGQIKKSYGPKLNQKYNKIKNLQSQKKCKEAKKDSAQKVTLDQITLEKCKFLFFSQYIKDKKSKGLTEKEFKKATNSDEYEQQSYNPSLFMAMSS